MTKFLKNTGLSLYRNYNSTYETNFNNWSEITINSAGQKIVTPCPQ